MKKKKKKSEKNEEEKEKKKSTEQKWRRCATGDLRYVIEREKEFNINKII